MEDVFVGKLTNYSDKTNPKRIADIQAIIDGVEAFGEIQLHLDYEGRTMHRIACETLADELPQYDFSTGYNYHCVVSKRPTGEDNLEGEDEWMQTKN
jgi:hypothetical protein